MKKNQEYIDFLLEENKKLQTEIQELKKKKFEYEKKEKKTKKNKKTVLPIIEKIVNRANNGSLLNESNILLKNKEKQWYKKEQLRRERMNQLKDDSSD